MILLANLGAGQAGQDGQSSKARQLAALLRKLRPGERLVVLDAGRSRSAALRLPFLAQCSELVVVVLAARGALVAAAASALASGLGKRHTLVYAVPGGWLGTFARANAWARPLLRRYRLVLVEAHAMAAELRDAGLNAHVFPNVRDLAPLPARAARGDGEVRLCFASRVMESKGIFTAIELTQRLAAAGVRCTLDVYGPVDPAIEARFLRAVESAPDVRYRGAFDGEARAVEVLRQYDWLVLPTAYAGECMPGIVVESYFAATPVLATQWRYIPEVVKDGKTGFLFPLEGFVDAAAQVVARCARDEAAYGELSRQCHAEALAYRTDANVARLAELLARS